jgi:hypothetical protein
LKCVTLRLDEDVAEWLKEILEFFFLSPEQAIDEDIQNVEMARLIIDKIIEGRLKTKIKMGYMS